MTGVIISNFAPKSPPTVSSPDTVYTGAINTRSNFILCVPSFLEVSFPIDHSSGIPTSPQEWSQLPERVNELQKFDAIVSHIIIKHFFRLVTTICSAFRWWTDTESCRGHAAQQRNTPVSFLRSVSSFGELDSLSLTSTQNWTRSCIDVSAKYVRSVTSSAAAHLTLVDTLRATT